MTVNKPLYGIAGAGTHWWATYPGHHKKKLQMETSSFDPCLLVSSAESHDFGIVGNLTTSAPVTFNGGTLSLTGENTLILRQKGQGNKLALVPINGPDAKQKYVEQRARGAYSASICQPEACFNLSSAAHHQDPSSDDIKNLNRRLQWQMDHPDRGFTFISVALPTAKLFVFVDGFFANNVDFTSQLRFVIVLANEKRVDDDTFTIAGNIVHFPSTKPKRVMRSVLASEVYGLLAGLGTTKEKRLMINIMALRQSYERRELHEVRWINGSDNPADTFTKASPNQALEGLISGNKIGIRMEGWVTRR
ncbi:hypothetical protein QIS74_13655 [Colletotrichum tabaci]|uniref:Uncharacterized protein n=1 Tax=Colletotrichum tabaci TaxID=1209068 RepID=A0AAV9SSQ2_9PEZI